MNKLFSLAVLFCCCTVTFSLRFYTRYDKLCVTECAKKGESHYWCYYGWRWDYCSPLENVDHLGRACRDDHPCDKYGYGYSWCYVNTNNNWGYCGAQGENLKVVASNGYYCTDKCRYYSSGKYYWCNTEAGWQYCSPKEGQDYRDSHCRWGHFCDKHGYDYYWCYIDFNNNWGYCGIDGDSKHLTSEGYYCSTECEKDGTDYFWCRSYNGWGYCSPTENSDSHGRACHEDHDCAKHGRSYTWCERNANNDWDYCGQLSDCSYLPDPLKTQSQHVKRQVRLCQVNDLGNRIHTEWLLLEDVGNINNNINRKMRTDAERAIAQWDWDHIEANTRAGTLLNVDNVRVDLQGMINRRGVRFANIQIQINIQRVPGQSTTIAAILLQAGQNIPVRYIRRALLLSLQEHGTVQLQTNRLPQAHI